MAKVFISYSHKDETWKNRIITHLGVLEDQGLSVWDDRKIAASGDWLSEIEKAMQDCQVALMLISSDFLTSKFIKRVEIPTLLERRQREGVKVIPVVLRPCSWGYLPWLSPIQGRPKDGKALSGMSKHKAEQAMSDLAGEILGLLKSNAAPLPCGQHASTSPHTVTTQIELSHLPQGADHFLWREDELLTLDTAWESRGKTVALEIIAPGGTGKTALTRHWLDRLRSQNWQGAERVFGWSFYSQGSNEDRHASEDNFLDTALKWFGVIIEPANNPADKGQALADELRRLPTLLILDGLEPLQYPQGPMEGELRAPGLQTLLRRISIIGMPGLILISSREKLKDLQPQQQAHNPNGVAQRISLNNLNPQQGAQLLHTYGVCKAGSATIGPEDQELQNASVAVSGHALSLMLLGRYLALAHDGDVRQMDRIDWPSANDEIENGHAFRVMRAYETWLQRSGPTGQRQLAALRLLAFFDRPASKDCLDALRQTPPLPQIGQTITNIKPAQWEITITQLAKLGLIQHANRDDPVDAHPLIRAYLAERLSQDFPEAWRKGHKRLFQRLQIIAPKTPKTLHDLQPLYQAVAHGCKAGLYQEALTKVYYDKILLQDKNFSIRQLGAFSDNLAAIACFFEEPWLHPVSKLTKMEQAWLLNNAAFSLRSLGRPAEALTPMQTGTKIQADQKDWGNATLGHVNISDLQLTSGNILDAKLAAEQAMIYARQSQSTICLSLAYTTHANALHQSGETENPFYAFNQAEAIQGEIQTSHKFLHSLQGFQYCDFLLVPILQHIWQKALTAGQSIQKKSSANPKILAINLQDITKRAKNTLEWVTKNFSDLLPLALEHLTLARCALYNDLLYGRPPGQNAQNHSHIAISKLRASGYMDYLPHGLLTRALLHFTLGDEAKARADLDEVEQVATRGGMRLYLADLALTRARLFRDKAQLALARQLIDECGYGRRLPELEDAEAALNGH